MLEKLYHFFVTGDAHMGRESRAIATLACVFVAVFAVCATPGLFAQAKPSGWQLPEDADTLKNPLTVDEKLLAGGKAVFKDKCQKCHGPGGLGDGPDADPDAAEDMDLTNPKRAERNSDGVVFYKVMNGRRKPKMPAFKEELSKDQVWAVVAYAQSLRRKLP
jgi:mono/diheme cytochrome c family protein